MAQRTRWFAWSLPESIAAADPQRRFRARVVLAMAFGSLPILTALCVTQYGVLPTRGRWLFGILFVAQGCAGFAVLAGRVRLAGMALTMCYFGVIFAGSVIEEMGRPTGFVYLAVLPLMSVFFVGRNYATWMAIFAMLGVVASMWGGLFPFEVDTDAKRLMVLSDLLGSVIYVAFLARAVDVSNRMYLDESLARAAEVARTKESLLANISHELRTPLASISGSLALLSQKTVTLDARTRDELVELAERDAARLRRLVDDVMDFARAEAGELRLRVERVDLTRLVQDAVVDRRCLPNPAGWTMTTDFPAEPVVAYVDPFRTRQILDNLLSNAAKWSPPMGRIDVSVRERSDAVEISVRDEGPGVPEAFECKLFERFSQSDIEPTTPSPSTGLGLAISRALARGQGGEITHERPREGGARFVVRLPRVWVRPEPWSPTRDGVVSAVYGPDE